MNVPLLITACSLSTGMVGMERWASWRLGVTLKRTREAAKTLQDAHAMTTPKRTQDPDPIPSSYLSGLHGGMTDA